MKKVLITGGAGFIGNEIVKQLHGKFAIVVLDSFSPQIHGRDFRESYLYQNIKDKCTIIKGDVCNAEDVFDALDGIDFVIHLAAA